MGKGRSEIKRIENTSQRQSTFYKRRDGLFKKARELAVLCDIDLLLLLFSSSGKLYRYHSPSVPSAEELIQRYEAATQKRVWIKDDHYLDQNAEIEKTEKFCELLEQQLRFMRVEEGQHYSLPALDILEQNMEIAINKVRAEKERKIEMEISKLDNLVRDGEQERYILHEKVANMEALKELGVGKPDSVGCGCTFSYELDLRLGLN